jgi:hypothetical protein
MKCEDYIGVLFFQSSGHCVPLKGVKITSVLQDLGMPLQRTYIDPNGADSKVLSEIFIQQNKMPVQLAMQ